MVLESLQAASSFLITFGPYNSPVRTRRQRLYPHFIDQETEVKRSLCSNIKAAWILEILALPFVDYQCVLGNII